MADKYIALNNGLPTEREGLVSSAGAADAGKIPALDAGGKLDASLIPGGVGGDVTRTYVAFEALASGDYVNVFDDAGTAKVRKADATNSRPAQGFVKTGVTLGANASVYLAGVNDQHTGLTPGANLFLSTTVPGEGTHTVPTGTGNLNQLLGYALSPTEVQFEYNVPVILA